MKCKVHWDIWKNKCEIIADMSDGGNDFEFIEHTPYHLYIIRVFFTNVHDKVFTFIKSINYSYFSLGCKNFIRFLLKCSTYSDVFLFLMQTKFWQKFLFPCLCKVRTKSNYYSNLISKCTWVKTFLLNLNIGINVIH